MPSIPYRDSSVELEGFAAYPKEKRRPVVILCHAWKGRDEFICEKAKMVAEWGYVGFALDMYGKGVVGKTKEENAALKKPFIEDRALLQRRVVRGFEAAQSLPDVDANRVAILGLGFGGICALDLARSGANVKGAISIYGHFDPPPHSLIYREGLKNRELGQEGSSNFSSGASGSAREHEASENEKFGGKPTLAGTNFSVTSGIKPIKAKVLIFHGYNDPITSPKELRSFEKEMDDAKVDWQLHVYGNTLHAFALPEANDREHGVLYNPTSASRTWKLTRQFLEEVLQ